MEDLDDDENLTEEELEEITSISPLPPELMDIMEKRFKEWVKLQI